LAVGEVAKLVGRELSQKIEFICDIRVEIVVLDDVYCVALITSSNLMFYYVIRTIFVPKRILQDCKWRLARCCV